MKFINVSGRFINLDLVRTIRYKQPSTRSDGQVLIAFYFDENDSEILLFPSDQARQEAVKDLTEQLDKLNGAKQ